MPPDASLPQAGAPSRPSAPASWAPRGSSFASRLVRSQASDLLGPTLSWLRWTVIATMLLITLAWPIPGRTGHPIWPLVAAFAGYNLLVELLRRRIDRLRSFAWVPFLDLPVAGLLFFLDTEPGGPLFVSFFLAVVTAAACWSLRGSVIYTVTVVGAIVGIAPTLPLWSRSRPGACGN